MEVNKPWRVYNQIAIIKPNIKSHAQIGTPPYVAPSSTQRAWFKFLPIPSHSPSHFSRHTRSIYFIAADSR